MAISKGPAERRMQTRLARALRTCALYAGGWTWEQAVKGSKVSGVSPPLPVHEPLHAVLPQRMQTETDALRTQKGTAKILRFRTKRAQSRAR